jgi:hypothetical protein
VCICSNTKLSILGSLIGMRLGSRGTVIGPCPPFKIALAISKSLSQSHSMSSLLVCPYSLEPGRQWAKLTRRLTISVITFLHSMFDTMCAVGMFDTMPRAHFYTQWSHFFACSQKSKEGTLMMANQTWSLWVNQEFAFQWEVQELVSDIFRIGCWVANKGS